ncbi:MAG: DUF3859 domain-containing protein [Marinilabiliaceae bacterium]|nr:DUF3859 domain-containing protein [Marinilabiliaceae bacterium]
MARKKIQCDLYSYGIYSSWNHISKEIPKLIDITTNISIKPGVEFGYVLKIKGAKGKTLNYCIDHPPMKDNNGKSLPSFEGTIFINSNDYTFFLGDTVWEPFKQMEGVWILTTKIDYKTIAIKKFTLFMDNQ